MKIGFTLAALLLCFLGWLASMAGAQTNRPAYATNWVTNPNLRVIAGKGYDSSRWQLFSEMAHCSLSKDTHQVVLVNGNEVLVQIYRYHFDQFGNLQTSGGLAVIFNYPEPDKILVGANIDCRCLRTTNVLINGISSPAFDCGMPFTNKVAVISRK